MNEFLVLMDNYKTANNYAETSANSAGSAMEKFSAYQESVASKINSTKASLQGLSEQFLKSKDVNSFVGGFGELVDLLSSANSQFGTVTTSLTLLTVAMSAMGKGLFSAKDGKLSLLGDSIDLKKFKAYRGELGLLNSISITTMKQFENGKSVLSDYNDAVRNGNFDGEKQIQVMADSDDTLKSLIKSKKEAGAIGESAVISEKEYATGLRATQAGLISTRIKTIALTAASTILNAALTFGVSIAITGLISLFEKYSNAQETAIEGQQELIAKSADNTEAYKQETDSLNSVIQKYTEIATSITDVASKKEELKSLQEEINALYKDEKTNIDLVNGSYADNLKAINEKKKTQANSYLDNTINKNNYEDAKSRNNFNQADFNRLNELTAKLNVESYNGQEKKDYESVENAKKRGLKIDQDTLESANKYADILNEIDAIQKRQDTGTTKIVGINFSDDFIQQVDDISKKYNLLYDKAQNGFGKNDSIELGGSLENQIKALTEMGDKYTEDSKYSSEFGSKINKEVDILKNLNDVYIQYGKTLKEFKDANVSDNTYSLLGQAQISEQNLVNSTSSGDKIKYFKQLNDELEQLGKIKNSKELEGNDTAQKAIQDFIDGVDTALQSANAKFTDDVDIINKTLNTLLTKGYPEAKEAITKIDTAINEIGQGKTLTSDEMVALNLVDPSLAKKFKKTTDGYIISIKDLEKARKTADDNYKNTTKSNIETTKQKIKDIKAEITADKVLLASKISFNRAMKVVNSIHESDILDSFTGKQTDNTDATKRDISAKTAHQKTLENDLAAFVNMLTALDDDTTATEKNATAIQKLTDKYNKLTEETTTYYDTTDNAIDDIIAKLQEEKDAQDKIVENQKSIADAAISELNVRKSSLEDLQKTSDDYYDNEIKKVEDAKKAKDDYYDSEIKKLQQTVDKRNESITLAEKENALANAKSQKIMVYSNSQGWHAESNIDEIKKAKVDLQNEKDNIKIQNLTNSKDTYDTKKDNAISKFTKTKEKKDTEYEAKIKIVENSIKEWENTLAVGENGQNESILKKAFGSNWKEKLLDPKTNKALAKSIAKSIGIATKKSNSLQVTIDGWNDFKKQIEDTAKAIKKKLDGINASVNGIDLSIKTSPKDRDKYFDGWVKHYSNLEKAAKKAKEAVDKANETGTTKTTTTTSTSTSTSKSKKKYANGGIADYTGLAQLDGSPNHTEVIFNATDAKKLFNGIHNMDSLSNSILRSVTSTLKSKSEFNTNSNTSNNATYQINVDRIITSSPEDFIYQLDSHCRSLRTKTIVNK